MRRAFYLAAIYIALTGAVNAAEPRITDPFGNDWMIREGTVALLRAIDDTWQPMRPADKVIADMFGFVWIGDGQSLMRFDPRKPDAGWTAVEHDNLPQVKHSTMAISPRGKLMLTIGDGSVWEVDIDKAGTVYVKRLAPDGLPVDQSSALQTHWRETGRMPFGNHDINGAVIGDTMYIAGGIADRGYPVERAIIDPLWAYDVNEENWRKVSHLPTPRGYCTIAALGRELWVIGGYINEEGKRKAVDTVEIFDVDSEKWRTGPALDEPRAEAVASVVNGRLYVIGGAAERKELASVISIAAGEDTWRVETPAPGPVRQAASCVLEGRIYVAAGHWVKSPGLYIFDPHTSRWSAKSNPLAERPANAPLMAAHNNEIWIMGGTAITDRQAVHRYDPLNDEWTAGPRLPIPLAWGAAAEIDGRLIIAGGAYQSVDHGVYVFSDRTFELRQ